MHLGESGVEASWTLTCHVAADAHLPENCDRRPRTDRGVDCLRGPSHVAVEPRARDRSRGSAARSTIAPRHRCGRVRFVGRCRCGSGGSCRTRPAEPVAAPRGRIACVVERALITDVGGTKRAIVDAAARLPKKTAFVGGHPLGGGARGGFEFATAGLFNRRPWILTPADSSADPTGAVERLSAFVTGLGAVPTVMPAADHDRLMAFISHLPQLTVTALMEVVGTIAGARRTAARRPGPDRHDSVGARALRASGATSAPLTRTRSRARSICSSNGFRICAAICSARKSSTRYSIMPRTGALSL